MSHTETKIITKDPFSIIKGAVDKAANIIKPTYGPASNKVIISKTTHFLVVDDGVQIARDLKFEDPQEEAVLRLIRATAVKTNDRVGDGTTSSIIMLQAIIEQIGKRTKWDGHKIEGELKKASVEAKKQLEAMATPVKTLEDLQKVARVSFDDEKISKTIAETWHKLGNDGVITVQGGVGYETTTEIADGLKFSRGYISPYMITNSQRMEAVIEKPYILITDYRLTEASDVLPIMDVLAAKNIFSLVIIAENIEQSALATLIVNKMQNKFTTVAINTPPAENQTQLLEDIARLTGARMISMHKGDKLQDATIEDLGRAERFVAYRESSAIVKPKSAKKDIDTTVSEIRNAIDAETDPSAKKSMEKRLAFFTSKVAVIKVCGPTQEEQRALQYKVEDSVNAVKSAYQGGVVPGAGLALASLKTSSEILNEALQYPFRQLMENMGLDHKAEEFLKGDKINALNVRTGKKGPYIQVGVIDPVDVLVAGIESAVSIASLLVTTSGMIVESVVEIKHE